MKVSTPLVSVVIPAYGAEQFIETTIHSVAGQTHRPLELIVVDDHSPDRTGEIAQRLASELASDDFTIRVLRHERNLGGAAALKTGFSTAEGEYICWLSADDAFAIPEKTANQVATMATGVDLTYDTCSIIGATPETAQLAEHHWGSRRYRASDEKYDRRPYWRLISLNFANPINGSSVMIRRAALERYGTFDPALGNVDQDSDMWLRFSALGARFASTPQAGGFYRIHAGQTSNRVDEVERGVTLTRMRVLVALADSGRLRHVLNDAWPVLLLTRPGLFVTRAAVTQALCVLGAASGCGPIPRVLLWGLRRAFVRHGLWDEASVRDAIAEARQASGSPEFRSFVERLNTN